MKKKTLTLNDLSDPQLGLIADSAGTSIAYLKQIRTGFRTPRTSKTNAILAAAKEIGITLDPLSVSRIVVP